MEMTTVARVVTVTAAAAAAAVDFASEATSLLGEFAEAYRENSRRVACALLYSSITSSLSLWP